MPPIADKITIDTDPNGSAWCMVLKTVPMKKPYAVAAKPMHSATGNNNHGCSPGYRAGRPRNGITQNPMQTMTRNCSVQISV